MILADARSVDQNAACTRVRRAEADGFHAAAEKHMGNTSGFMFARDTFRIPDLVTFVKAFCKKMIEFVGKKYREKRRGAFLGASIPACTSERNVV